MNKNTFRNFAGMSLAFGLSTPLINGAVYSHYTFDTDYTDSSGNAHHGTLTDVGTTGNTFITTTPGDFKFGSGAIDFSNDRDYVALTSKTFGTGSAYTIAFWAEVDSASRTWNMAIGQRDNTKFFIAPNGAADNLRWRSNNTASGTREVDFATGVNDTNWHHYALVVDTSKNMSLYLDGSHVSTTADVETGFIIDTIGDAYTDTDLDFQGRMDELWIFDEAIDAATVGHLFNTNTTTAVPEPSSAALLGLGGLALILRRRK